MSGRTAMVLLLLAVSGFRLMAQEDEFPHGPEGGAKLAAKLRDLRPEANTNWSGVLTVTHRTPKVPPIAVLCETTLGTTNWTVTYSTGATNGVAAEKLTVVHSADGPNRYLYARAATPGGPLGEPKELKGAEADIPLAGTDFWLSDLGFEFYHWPGQQILPHQPNSDLRRGRAYYLLECVNPHPAAGGYSRVLVYVDKEFLAPLEAEAYRADSPNKFKLFELGSTENKQLKSLQIHDEKSNSTTKLEFELEKK